MTAPEKMLSAFTIIRSDADYQAALARAQEWMDSEPDTPQAAALDVLALLIERYEDEHFPIEPPSLIDALEFRMEQRFHPQ